MKLILPIVLTTILIVANCHAQVSDEVLFTLDGNPHTVKEFNYYFLKNNDEPESKNASSAINEYLDLFTDFRLKVQEAYDLKMDEDLAFIKELEGYDKQLLEPYLTTTKVTEEIIKEAYDRLKYEIAGSHILVAHPRSKLPEDTLKAYNKILGIKKKAEAGEDFAELAIQYSEDRSAKGNKGYLGYFTAMQMVYPFENAAYNNSVGDLVGPFRTRFGYHLLRIEDKREARGQVSCAHIMTRFTEDSTSRSNAEKKILAVYDNLINGKDWNEQCELYSDDKNTAKAGGQLRWFGTGQLVPKFEDVAFSMNTKDSISEPFQTRFGWHIIRFYEKKGLAPFEEKKEEIKTKIARDIRTTRKNSVAVQLIKDQYGFVKNQEGYNKAFAAFDSTLSAGKWLNPNTNHTTLTLFEIGNSVYKVEDFWNYVVENQRPRMNVDLPTTALHLYNRFEETSILSYEKEVVRNTNVEYQMIYDEYKSGILLFNLMEQKVWNRAMKDTLGLRQYYEEHKNQYQSEERVKARKLVLSNADLLDSLQNNLHLDNKSLEQLFNSDNALTLQASDVISEKGYNQFIDEHWSVGTYIEPLENNIILWKIEEILPKGFKEFNSVKGLVISDYQTKLEKEWLQTLRKKYPVKLDKKVLKAYINSF